jgi:septal ring-binding cell division protein DamX
LDQENFNLENLNMKKHIIIFNLILLLISYTVGQEFEEKFNPDKLTDYQPEWPVLLNQITDSIPEELRLYEMESEKSEISGYRIQLLATTSAAEADSFKMEISKLIRNEIYIIFEAPNYKVRIGNFLHRNNAQRALDEIQAMGFQQAWVVRTRIESLKN